MALRDDLPDEERGDTPQLVVPQRPGPGEGQIVPIVRGQVAEAFATSADPNATEVDQTKVICLRDYKGPNPKLVIEDLASLEPPLYISVSLSNSGEVRLGVGPNTRHYYKKSEEVDSITLGMYLPEGMNQIPQTPEMQVALGFAAGVYSLIRTSLKVVPQPSLKEILEHLRQQQSGIIPRLSERLTEADFKTMLLGAIGRAEFAEEIATASYVDAFEGADNSAVRMAENEEKLQTSALHAYEVLRDIGSRAEKASLSGSRKGRIRLGVSERTRNLFAAIEDCYRERIIPRLVQESPTYAEAAIRLQGPLDLIRAKLTADDKPIFDEYVELIQDELRDVAGEAQETLFDELFKTAQSLQAEAGRVQFVSTAGPKQFENFRSELEKIRRRMGQNLSDKTRIPELESALTEVENILTTIAREHFQSELDAILGNDLPQVTKKERITLHIRSLHELRTRIHPYRELTALLRRVDKHAEAQEGELVQIFSEELQALQEKGLAVALGDGGPEEFKRINGRSSRISAALKQVAGEIERAPLSPLNRDNIRVEALQVADKLSLHISGLFRIRITGMGAKELPAPDKVLAELPTATERETSILKKNIEEKKIPPALQDCRESINAAREAYGRLCLSAEYRQELEDLLRVRTQDIGLLLSHIALLQKQIDGGSEGQLAEGIEPLIAELGRQEAVLMGLQKSVAYFIPLLKRERKEVRDLEQAHRASCKERDAKLQAHINALQDPLATITQWAGFLRSNDLVDDSHRSDLALSITAAQEKVTGVQIQLEPRRTGVRKSTQASLRQASTRKSEIQALLTSLLENKRDIESMLEMIASLRSDLQALHKEYGNYLLRLNFRLEQAQGAQNLASPIIADTASLPTAPLPTLVIPTKPSGTPRSELKPKPKADCTVARAEVLRSQPLRLVRIPTAGNKGVWAATEVPLHGVASGPLRRTFQGDYLLLGNPMADLELMLHFHSNGDKLIRNMITGRLDCLLMRLLQTSPEVPEEEGQTNKAPVLWQEFLETNGGLVVMAKLISHYGTDVIKREFQAIIEGPEAGKKELAESLPLSYSSLSSASQEQIFTFLSAHWSTLRENIIGAKQLHETLLQSVPVAFIGDVLVVDRLTEEVLDYLLTFPFSPEKILAETVQKVRQSYRDERKRQFEGTKDHETVPRHEFLKHWRAMTPAERAEHVFLRVERNGSDNRDYELLSLSLEQLHARILEFHSYGITAAYINQPMGMDREKFLEALEAAGIPTDVREDSVLEGPKRNGKRIRVLIEFEYLDSIPKSLVTGFAVRAPEPGQVFAEVFADKTLYSNLWPSDVIREEVSPEVRRQQGEARAANQRLEQVFFEDKAGNLPTVSQLKILHEHGVNAILFRNLEGVTCLLRLDADLSGGISQVLQELDPTELVVEVNRDGSVDVLGFEYNERDGVADPFGRTFQQVRRTLISVEGGSPNPVAEPVGWRARLLRAVGVRPEAEPSVSELGTMSPQWVKERGRIGE